MEAKRSAEPNRGQHSAPLPPHSNSGKRLVLIFLITMAAVGLSLGYVLWTYSQLDRARDQTAIAWRDLSQTLGDRYSALASSNPSPELAAAYEQFSTTVDVGRQLTAAQELEDKLAPASLPAPTTEQEEALAKFAECVEREDAIMRTVGGRVLDIFFAIEQRQPLELNP